MIGKLLHAKAEFPANSLHVDVLWEDFGYDPFHLLGPCDFDQPPGQFRA